MSLFMDFLDEQLSDDAWAAPAQHRTLRDAQQHLQAIHERVYPLLRSANLDLHLLTPRADSVRYTSVSAHHPKHAMSIAYLRPREQAVTVERLMGREEVASLQTVEAHRHPVIELRLIREYLSVELLISPDAWWDQQNLVGKLSIPEHRHDFHQLLMQFNDDYRMGFWQGVHLSEMHLRAKHFQHPRIMDEWMSTFHPGADWFRLGRWRSLDELPDTLNDLHQELLQDIRSLYDVYEHILWKSNNNYSDFYSR